MPEPDASWLTLRTILVNIGFPNQNSIIPKDRSRICVAADWSSIKRLVRLPSALERNADVVRRQRCSDIRIRCQIQCLQADMRYTIDLISYTNQSPIVQKDFWLGLLCRRLAID